MLRPASFDDLVDLLKAQGRLTLPARSYGALLAQIALSDAYAVLDKSQGILAIGGIAPLSAEAGELWFGVRPRVSVGSVVTIAVHAKRVLRMVKHRYPAGLVCFVRPGHRPGERLASLLGFAPSPVMLGEHREWVLVDGIRRESAGSEAVVGVVSDDGRKQSAAG